jgi:hypothetical protein
LWRCDVVDVGRRRLSKRVAIDANVFYPFEYPKQRVLNGRAWNEIYVLRRFLEYNERFRIVLMNTFLEHFHEDSFRERMPLCLENRGGSIWLRKD